MAFRLTKLRIIPTALALAFLLTLQTAISAQAQPMEADALQQALRQDDWESVMSFAAAGITNLAPCERDIPNRFLYGHAALATGKHSDAVAHFHCAADTTAAETIEWLEWVQALAQSAADNPTVLYLHGDALARNGDLSRAHATFSDALALDSDYAPALNARGITRWLLLMSDEETYVDFELEAIADLQKATEVAPAFADAWANIGVIKILDSSETSMTQAAFDRALDIDPAFWLALNGKAVTFGAAGEFAKFNKLTDQIKGNAPTTPFLSYNTGNGPSTSRGASGTEWSATLGGSIGLPGPLSGFGSINASVTVGRGGIFMYLKDGENFVINEENQQRSAGTWFLLNYPQPGPESPAPETTDATH